MRNLKITNLYPDCDAVSLEFGNFHISIWLSADEFERETHVDIWDKDKKSMEYIILGKDPEEGKNEVEK